MLGLVECSRNAADERLGEIHGGKSPTKGYPRVMTERKGSEGNAQSVLDGYNSNELSSERAEVRPMGSVYYDRP